MHYSWYNFVQNVISSSVAAGSDYLPQISSKSVQYSREAKEMATLALDIGTTRHSET